jgi:hypothetical protein
MSGNTDRDLLIGGTGLDSLSGHSGDDILIGGTTDYDSDAAALLALLDEWTQPTDIDTRIDHLTSGGGLNLGYLLQPNETVHSDDEENELRGGSQSDWFLQFALDQLLDKGPQDR